MFDLDLIRYDDRFRFSTKMFQHKRIPDGTACGTCSILILYSYRLVLNVLTYHLVSRGDIDGTHMGWLRVVGSSK